MRPPVAENYVGGRGVLETLQKEFGLKASHQGKRLTVFLRDDVDAAVMLAHLSGWKSDQIRSASGSSDRSPA